MSKEPTFWQFFASEEEVLFGFEKDQRRLFARLAQELQKVHPDLTFEFGPVTEGKRQFVISAGGIKKAFTAVESLYGARPELRRFDVIKFRPRRDVVSDINYRGMAIRAKDVYYHLYDYDKHPDKVAIRLFLPGYSNSKQAEFGQIGYLMLDEAIGEYFVVMCVDSIQLAGHDSSYFAGARPIQELGGHFIEVITSKISKTGPLH
jgi:signal peptidase I